MANNVAINTTVDQVQDIVNQFPESHFIIALLNPLSEESGFKDFNQQLFKMNKRMMKQFAGHSRVSFLESMAPSDAKEFRLTRSYNGDDGIHFSESGYEVWRALWTREITQHLN